MLGAFIGDSIGAYLEFETGTQDELNIDKWMQMPGGGCWGLRPGQITDDSELAMCQLRGLLAGKGKFDMFHHALYFGSWVEMGPFDIGNTTRIGLCPQAEILHSPNPVVSQRAAR